VEKYAVNWLWYVLTPDEISRERYTCWCELDCCGSPTSEYSMTSEWAYLPDHVFEDFMERHTDYFKTDFWWHYSTYRDHLRGNRWVDYWSVPGTSQVLGSLKVICTLGHTNLADPWTRFCTEQEAKELLRPTELPQVTEWLKSEQNQVKIGTEKEWQTFVDVGKAVFEARCRATCQGKQGQIMNK